jgi:hypothetical protein
MLTRGLRRKRDWVGYILSVWYIRGFMLKYFAIKLAWRRKRKTYWSDLFYQVIQIEFIRHPQLQTSELKPKENIYCFILLSVLFQSLTHTPEDDRVNSTFRLKDSKTEMDSERFQPTISFLLGLWILRPLLLKSNDLSCKDVFTAWHISSPICSVFCLVCFL